MSDYANWYNKIYKNRANYNPKDNKKLDIVKNLVSSLPKGSLVLDVGCGRGHFLKQFIDLGYHAFGIEPSTECSIRYLGNLPHEIIDFNTYVEENTEDYYNLVFCTDVLEHIKPEDLDTFIKNLSLKGSKAILGIANHSDIQEGIELHLIQEPWLWWKKELEKHFKRVNFICSLHNERFFFCEAIP